MSNMLNNFKKIYMNKKEESDPDITNTTGKVKAYTSGTWCDSYDLSNNKDITSYGTVLSPSITINGSSDDVICSGTVSNSTITTTTSTPVWSYGSSTWGPGTVTTYYHDDCGIVVSDVRNNICYNYGKNDVLVDKYKYVNNDKHINVTFGMCLWGTKGAIYRVSMYTPVDRVREDESVFYDDNLCYNIGRNSVVYNGIRWIPKCSFDLSVKEMELLMGCIEGV